MLVSQSCQTLCNPMECRRLGSSVHGISQARILQWVAVFFSRGSSQPWEWTQVYGIAGRFFFIWATREALDSMLKNRNITLPTKVHRIQTKLFFFFFPPSNHVWTWELNHKEGWAPKNWHFQIVVLEKTSDSLWREKRLKLSVLKESTLNIQWTLKLKLQYFGHLMQQANSF